MSTGPARAPAPPAGTEVAFLVPVVDPSHPLRRALDRAWPPAAVVGLAVLAWHAAARASELPAFVLPAPADVAAAAWETRELLGPAIRATLVETAVGLLAAVVLAVALAVPIAASPLLRRALYPLLVASQTVQILAVAPLLIIWFGFGLLPKVLVVVLICFFPLAVSTADGLASADPDHVALLRGMGASRRQVWRIVRLPAALPAFFSGLKVAVTYAVVGATIGEWVGGSEGLGLFMLRARNAFRADRVFAGMLVTSALSIGLFAVTAAAERLALPWHHAFRRAR